jgi:glycosyltransferase involved in cell wall biosynthesis
MHSPPDQSDLSSNEHLWTVYQQLSDAICKEEIVDPRGRLDDLYFKTLDGKLHALLQNDLAVLDAQEGNLEIAKKRLLTALARDPECETARANLHALNSPQTQPSRTDASTRLESDLEPPIRVAILSLLFNWPSTGGGTVHTYETAKFLATAGYAVKHFYAVLPEWGLGKVSEPLAAPSEAIHFSPGQWQVAEIQARFQAALKTFGPDWVIITDSWNSKPILAEAARDYRFILRIAAQECLCPLNNVRLLYEEGRIRSCPRHQLATPETCCQCVFQKGRTSGSLHQAERELVGYGTREYDRSLRWAFAQAEAVLVVNPLIGAMVSPHARRVCVVPSGFDPARFPSPRRSAPSITGPKLKILFAGLVDELMKGYRVVHEACARLWQERQDFELLATADPPGSVDPFTRYIGWQSQSALPEVIREADILVFPTVAEEALGRTAVEAMGAGRPVVASRIGGLQFTVVDGSTGLLFEPGDVKDLSQKLNRLLDDHELRERMGRAGRERFDEHYTWDAIINRHYHPLLAITRSAKS